MFSVDWKSLEAVIAFSETLGPGMTVIKHPDRDNYNIVHTSRTDLTGRAGVVIHHQT